ncbi:cysteine hydrolase family protein [Actinocrispum wychmicini]|uniref:Nicotinamidase-related amidase n=1 Tax=Actinocrispum wychmicini TaxID=1213861 RepID=A0A4V2S8T4_9PSEU|nr:isochorismatase family protein [Actinocrispum wychmicini]TCO65110.1 nicotinamidase-related amidase [Actinocrispum wychmicini]
MTKALIVIDVQESFRQRPDWAEVSAPDIVERTNLLVDHARAENDLVVWVLHSEAGSGTVFDPASGHVRLQDGLKQEDGEPLVTKTSHNAFTTTNLQQILTERGIRELLISGIRTEQCCETTARVGSDLGFDITFVTDATATSPVAHWKTGVVLGTKEIIERTEYALAGRFATIATVADLTGVR